jgi:tetratricopeptide (TPR) repeat protein
MTQIDCETALALSAAGQKDKATEIFKRLSEQKFRDDDAEKRIAQAIAWKQLGDASKAEAIFDDLIAKLTPRLGGGDGGADFFAKFGEQQSRAKRKADTHYALGLALMYKGQIADAKENFKQALALNASLPWARYYLSQLEK